MNPNYALKLREILSELKPDQNLLIVSKNRSLAEIQAYYDLGHRDFGENRVQELKEKSLALKDSCPEIRWHMIGHLQSNKINQLFEIEGLWAIHSVDDREILEKMLKAEHRLHQPVKIFLQVNTSREEEKSGFEDLSELISVVRLFPQDSLLNLYGLMTMGTIRTGDQHAEARRCFQELNDIKALLEKEHKLTLKTSMGMSQDYQIALSENSHWIRLGSIMF